MKRADKAYKNLEFLTSRKGRSLRILAEYLEPEKRFEDKNIKHTVVFFGSARIQSSQKNNSPTKKYYTTAENFAYRLATWAHELARDGDSFTICTGGGPGIMEAANKGAQRAHSLSIGLNISIPLEQLPNKYITPELNFEFHYFFMRKLWFLYHAKAVIVFPGGLGTLDELFETLTLVQTHKMDRKNMIILLYDKKFWEEVIDFEKLITLKLISRDDLELFHYFETVDEGLDYIKPRLKKIIREFHI